MREKNEENLRSYIYDWLSPIGKDDLYLQDKVRVLEDRYFKDMRLESYGWNLALRCDSQVNTLFGDVIVESGPMEIGYDWELRVAKGNDSMGGICIGKDRLIVIAEDRKDDDILLLNMMLQGYDYMLLELGAFREYVLLKLYERLYTSIGDLMELVKIDNHIDNVEESVLFMLKSLELDLLLKKPLGTVYGQDRIKLYEKAKLGLL